MLFSLDGKQIHPKDKKIFKESTEEIKLKTEGGFVLDREYVLTLNIKGFRQVCKKAVVKDGLFTVLKVSIRGNIGKGAVPYITQNAKIKDNVLQEDVICMTPSSA